MYEIRLRQSGSTYSACGLITKSTERIKKSKKVQIQYVCVKRFHPMSQKINTRFSSQFTALIIEISSANKILV